MNDTNEMPDWKKNWTPDPDAPKTGNPNWKKGVSGNPKGRPKGRVDRRYKVTKMLEDDADKVVRVIIDAALEGDVHAASLVLSRIAPVMKAQAEKVNFDFDATAPMTEQVQAVLQGIADGELSPDTGKQIIEAIASLAGVKAMDELEQRLASLEAS